MQEQPKAKEVVVKPQQAAPVVVKSQEPAPVVVKPKEPAPTAVKSQEAPPVTVKPQETAPVAVKAPTKDTATTGTDSAAIYASGNMYDILDQAVVDARNGKVEQAQASLSSLLKDKDAAVMAGYELGLIHYENSEVDKAMPFFKNALSAAFPVPASGKDEQALTASLNQEADAARIRYELGLVCQSLGKKDQAAKLFRDSLSILSAKDAPTSASRNARAVTSSSGIVGEKRTW